MARQGPVTIATCRWLTEHGWTVVYRCVPNTPHIAVVPIPIAQGSARQRYPDIVAIKADVTRLVEVEPTLSEAVADDIELRFREMTQSLANQATWEIWTNHIHRQLGIAMPGAYMGQMALVVCAEWSPNADSLSQRLRLASITVNYYPAGLVEQSPP